MKICLAQTNSDKGKIEKNIVNHKKWIAIAVLNKADLIIFPELSLTGYEPELAAELATTAYDSRLDEFQNISDQNKIAIGVGLPTIAANGVLISMVIFQPKRPRQIYSKQHLHYDEKPFFVAACEQVILTIEKTKIALAICYESLLLQHSENANKLGAAIYVASVAKSKKGIEKASAHFPSIANKFSMNVLMVNSVGYCDNFLSAGKSSAWNENGMLVEQLDHHKEGCLIYDTVLKQAIKSKL